MENSNEEKEKEITAEKGVARRMKSKLDSLDYQGSKCCIYKVPEFVRKGRGECYRPFVISIGPMYYKNTQLKTMQKLKWVTLKWFLEHEDSGRHSLEYYLEFIKQEEEKIRECYQEIKMKIPSNEFLEMILLDAAFIIYLFMNNWKNDGYSYEIGKIPKEIEVLMQGHMDRDLFVLENQLPYFILKGLYDISFGRVSYVSFTELTRKYVGNLTQGTLPVSKAVESPVAIDTITEASKIEHLVDFLCCCLPPHPRDQRCSKKPGRKVDKTSRTAIEKIKNLVVGFQSSCLRFVQLVTSTQEQQQEQRANKHELLFTAKELSAAGVKFKPSESLNPVDIHYTNGILEIPKIFLEDYTESALRNILYFEQCNYFEASYIIDYIFFLDALINTVEDIQILVESNILHSLLGSHEEAVDVFNKVTKNSTLNGNNFYYSEVSRRLNAYTKTPWN